MASRVLMAPGSLGDRPRWIGALVPRSATRSATVPVRRRRTLGGWRGPRRWRFDRLPEGLGELGPDVLLVTHVVVRGVDAGAQVGLVGLVPVEEQPLLDGGPGPQRAVGQRRHGHGAGPP